MRDISQNLLRGQRARSIPHDHILIRAVLSYGATTYTYTTTKIKKIVDAEQSFGRKCQLVIEDNDKTIHGLDLEGYKVVMGYGLITKAGAEWVDTAPMWVVGQDRDSYREELEVGFELEGIFDRMGKHKAHASVRWATDSTIAAVTHLAAVIEATGGSYSDYPAYTFTKDTGWDDDGLSGYHPSFGIGLRDTRLGKVKELLRYTKAILRAESDEEVHLFTPVTTGTTYDAEFSLTQGRDFHSFFNKRFRRRVVSPNKITFQSLNDAGIIEYTGSASDASASLDESSGGNGSMLEVETIQGRATSNAEAALLAAALLLKRQLEADKGGVVLPFWHLGLEIGDYVNVVDARAGDSRAGNVGYLTRYYEPGQLYMQFGFGKVPLGVPGLRGLTRETMPGGGQQAITAANLIPIMDNLFSFIEQIIDILGQKADVDSVNAWITDFMEDAHFIEATIERQLNIPSEAA